MHRSSTDVARETRERALRRLMAERSIYSLAGLSRVSTLAEHAIHSALRGKTRPIPASIAKLALALGVSDEIIAELFQGGAQ